jgi:predicted protein tyrosine phosphatase
MTNPESIRLRLEDLPAELRCADDATPLPPAKSPAVTLSGIEDHPDGVAELADVLNEVAPTLGLHSYPKSTPPRTPGTDSHRWQTAQANVLLRERLRNAVPMPSGTNQIDWSALTATITSEMLASEELTALGTPSPEAAHPRTAPPPTTPGGSLVEVNSGGRVLFCLFELDADEAAAAAAGRAPGSAPAEGCLVVKFNRTRLLCQSEQFANELARHVGICSPDSRILRAAGGDGEWAAALAAAERLSGAYPELLEEMIQCGSLLVLEYCPGKGIFRTSSAFDPGAVPYTFEDLGRLFALDLVLGNPDRLKCDALGWRGNSENVLWASAGRWQGRLVAIDAVVQRRPPGALLSAEYAAAEQVVELTLNNAEVAASALAEALSMSPAALAAMGADPSGAVEAFQRGLRRGMEAMMGLKGLLEMMFDVVADWIHDFIEDINGVAAPDGGGAVFNANGNGAAPMSARRSGSAGPTSMAGMGASMAEDAAEDTFKIRRINAEAAHNRSVGEKVSEWKAAFRAKGEDLRAAVEEWQAKRGSGKPLMPPTAIGVDSSSDDSEEATTPRIGTSIASPRPPPKLSPAPSLGADFASPRSAATASGVTLTTGFLDGTHPVVDVYELKVRLEHMLRRLRVLQQASATAAPTALLPGLYLSGAVEASSLHILRHCGITHVLNCTEDLLLPEETQSFTGMRIPLRDVEEEDITPYFAPAADFIDAAMEGGGNVLVHCHAGRSRSCSLVLAWLMTRRRWPLRRALELLQERRPEAAPNAGYMQQLAELEGELFGTQTVKVKKTKPEPKRCPECGEKIGLSAESVRVHIRLKHPSKAAALLSSPVKGGAGGELRASMDRVESVEI